MSAGVWAVSPPLCSPSSLSPGCSGREHGPSSRKVLLTWPGAQGWSLPRSSHGKGLRCGDQTCGVVNVMTAAAARWPDGRGHAGFSSGPVLHALACPRAGLQHENPTTHPWGQSTTARGPRALQAAPLETLWEPRVLGTARRAALRRPPWRKEGGRQPRPPKCSGSGSLWGTDTLVLPLAPSPVSCGAVTSEPLLSLPTGIRARGRRGPSAPWTPELSVCSGLPCPSCLVGMAAVRRKGFRPLCVSGRGPGCFLGPGGQRAPLVFAGGSRRCPPRHRR